MTDGEISGLLRLPAGSVCQRRSLSRRCMSGSSPRVRLADGTLGIPADALADFQRHSA